MSQVTNPRQTERSGEQSPRRPGDAGQRSSTARVLRGGVSSGVFAGVAGVVSLGWVRRALREGSTEQAVKRGMLFVFCIGVAMMQWGLNRSEQQA